MHIVNYPGIENLHAAGEVLQRSSWQLDDVSLGSCATLDCLSFGRIAGHNVVMVKDHIEYTTLLREINERNTVKLPYRVIRKKNLST
jgi:succinate dehydrogenase/fumarate reductase flavoprotein subunit